MEELFGSNQFALYLIACVAVISYSNFRENQRMFLLYLFTFATAFFEIFRISSSLILLLLITFIFLEYLTDDTKKLTVITNFFYKICDYFFMMFFQYSFFWVLTAFGLLYAAHCHDGADMVKTVLKGASLLSLCLGAHLTVSQPFKIKTITEICQVFDMYPPYRFTYTEEMQEKFNLLCAFEDKTYFQRKNSYSCVSLEYAACFLANHDFPKRRIVRQVISSLPTPRNLVSMVRRLFKRGYSTPEMQLLRTIGIIRGYDRYKVQRKLFEILYSKIFFSSLKAYHQANTHLTLQHYRHYLLSVYLQTVMTKINGHRCMPLASAFEDRYDMQHWSMDGLFIACLGLSFRQVSPYHLQLFGDIIHDFGLDPARIEALNTQYPKKFPLEAAAESVPVG